MSFTVFADGTANLPKDLREGVEILPCAYTVDGIPGTYLGDLEAFDVHAYYEKLKSGTEVKTSLLNTQLFLERFGKSLEEGRDVIYVAMSSGISGTYGAACIAARELMEENPDRFVHIVDSKGCGLGTGLLVLRAAQYARDGMDAHRAAELLDEEVPNACQYFTVDDLNFLKRTGRVSGMTARIGTVLNIKPILFGNREGHIVSCGVSRGRKRAIDDLVRKYREKHKEVQDLGVYISHGDCAEDAEKLAEKVREISPRAAVTVVPHEPFSGAHVGPGMLALFFLGKER